MAREWAGDWNMEERVCTGSTMDASPTGCRWMYATVWEGYMGANRMCVWVGRMDGWMRIRRSCKCVCGGANGWVDGGWVGGWGRFSHAHNARVRHRARAPHHDTATRAGDTLTLARSLSPMSLSQMREAVSQRRQAPRIGKRGHEATHHSPEGHCRVGHPLHPATLVVGKQTCPSNQSHRVATQERVLNVGVRRLMFWASQCGQVH